MDITSFESAMHDDKSSSNAVFSLLPSNLHERILNSLALTERMSTRLVSQRWNNVALSSVQLNLQIDAEEFNVDGGGIKAAFSPKKATPAEGPTIEHPEMASLDDVWQLPAPLMDRCFLIRLALGSGCNAPAGLLSRIAAQISRPCKLSLATVDLPLSVFTGSKRPCITFAKEFPGLQLHSLSLESKHDGSSTGNNNLLNYFRADRGTNRCNSIALRVLGPLSRSITAIIVERYRQATELCLDLYSRRFGNDSSGRVQPPTNADWLILNRLTELRKLTIYIDGQTTVKLPGLHLPQLDALRCQNAILPTEADFFARLPQLERLELKRTDDGNYTTEVKIIATAIRTGQLPKLVVAKFTYGRASLATDFECMQLLFKAILESGTTAFRRLCWLSILIDECGGQPGLIQLLNGLPEGCFQQRPLAVMITCSDIYTVSNYGLNDILARCVLKIIKAMIRSGLSQLTISAEISDDQLLKILSDVLSRSATDLGVECGLVHERRVPEDVNIEDEIDLRESFVPLAMRPISEVLRIKWEANGQQQKLELVESRSNTISSSGVHRFLRGRTVLQISYLMRIRKLNYNGVFWF